MGEPPTFPFRRCRFARRQRALPGLKRWQGSPWRRRCLQLRYPTPATIELPQPLGDRPPDPYAPLWQHSGRGWSRDARALSLMAVTGWCSRLSLTEWLVAHDPSLGAADSGSVKRLWQRLTRRELDFGDPLAYEYRITIDAGHHFQVATVCLTGQGRDFVNEMGIPLATVCEWDRLDRRHHGHRQPVHSAMVILAAHYFRRHGFWTQVCPVLPWPLAPDLLVVDPASERRLYVEVEAPQATGRAKAERLRRKWELQLELQGFACLVALSPRQRVQRQRSAAAVAADGLATDLRSLSHEPGTLWTATWGRFSRHNPFAGSAAGQTPGIQGGGGKPGRTGRPSLPLPPGSPPSGQTLPAPSADQRGPDGAPPPATPATDAAPLPAASFHAPSHSR